MFLPRTIFLPPPDLHLSVAAWIPHGSSSCSLPTFLSGHSNATAEHFLGNRVCPELMSFQLAVGAEQQGASQLLLAPALLEPQVNGTFSGPSFRHTQPRSSAHARNRSECLEHSVLDLPPSYHAEPWRLLLCSQT